MASIIKRKKNYSIVYTYVDENGETKQKWETRTSYQEALKRKAEIESQKSSNSFLPPTNQNIAEFLSDFVSLYGEKRWGVSMYDSQNSLIANYINPIIGDMKVQDITTRVVDKYIQTLQKTPAVNTRTHHAKTEFVTNATIEKIIKLLRCAFKQAVRWELVAKNPFDNVVLPKVEYKKAGHLDCRYDPHRPGPVYGQQALCSNEPGLCLFAAHGRDSGADLEQCPHLR